MVDAQIVNIDPIGARSMTWVPDKPADRRGVERALRRAYPTGILDEVEVSALDLDLPEARLSALFTEIASLPRLKAVIEVEIVRSHVLHVTSEDHPDWEQMNREFTDRERKAAVSAAEGGILYWNVLLSRIGPFWTGYWNSFQLRRGGVFPEVVSGGEGGHWPAITRQVKATLATFGFRQVGEDLLNAPIHWLAATRAAGASSPGSVRPSTVYDGLFSDVY